MTGFFEGLRENILHIFRALETLGKRNPDFVDSIPCSACAEKFSAGNLYIRQGLLKIWTEHFPYLVFKLADRMRSMRTTGASKNPDWPGINGSDL